MDEQYVRPFLIILQTFANLMVANFSRSECRDLVFRNYRRFYANVFKIQRFYVLLSEKVARKTQELMPDFKITVL